MGFENAKLKVNFKFKSLSFMSISKLQTNYGGNFLQRTLFAYSAS